MRDLNMQDRANIQLTMICSVLFKVLLSVALFDIDYIIVPILLVASLSLDFTVLQILKNQTKP